MLPAVPELFCKKILVGGFRELAQRETLLTREDDFLSRTVRPF
jgi:hypothetical protein